MTLTYAVQRDGRIENKDLPFVIGVLGAFGGSECTPRRLRERSFVDVTGGLDPAFRKLKPRLALQDGREIGNRIDLRFGSLADFEPAGVAQHFPDLDQMLLGRRRLADRLDRVLHEPSFQALEALWRGLSYLCGQVQQRNVKVRVFDISKQELMRDLQCGGDLGRSVVHAQLQREFASLGREPFGLLVGAYEFSHESADVELLTRISQVASAAHCPFLSAAAPEMLQAVSFAELSRSRSLSWLFQCTKYDAWRAFRSTRDSQYVGLTIPHILLRRPYAGDLEGNGLPGLYRESIATDSDLLWGNAAFGVAAALAKGATTSGGRIQDLIPLETPSTLPLTDAPVGGQLGAELAAHGFIALHRDQAAGEAAFFDTPTCRRAGAGDSESVRMDEMVLANRFAHCVRCAIRMKLGVITHPAGWEAYLNSWLNGYAAPGKPGEPADYPLLSGSARFAYGWGYIWIVLTLVPNLPDRHGEMRAQINLPMRFEYNAFF